MMILDFNAIENAAYRRQRVVETVLQIDLHVAIEAVVHGFERKRGKLKKIN